MKLRILSLFMLALILSSYENEYIEINPSQFSLELSLVSKQSVLRDSNYYTWGGSPIKGDDGLYHLYYSRWKKAYGFLAWVTHSEIAHAISEHRERPQLLIEEGKPTMLFLAADILEDYSQNDDEVSFNVHIPIK